MLGSETPLSSPRILCDTMLTLAESHWKKPVKFVPFNLAVIGDNCCKTFMSASSPTPIAVSWNFFCACKLANFAAIAGTSCGVSKLCSRVELWVTEITMLARYLQYGGRIVDSYRWLSRWYVRGCSM